MLKYEVKRFKETLVVENIAPASVEERAVEPLIDNSIGIESLKNTVNELEEALRCLKHKIKQIKSTTPEATPVEQTPVDLSPLENDVRCLKYEVCPLKMNHQDNYTPIFNDNEEQVER